MHNPNSIWNLSQSSLAMTDQFLERPLAQYKAAIGNYRILIGQIQPELLLLRTELLGVSQPVPPLSWLRLRYQFDIFSPDPVQIQEKPLTRLKELIDNLDQLCSFTPGLPYEAIDQALLIKETICQFQQVILSVQQPVRSPQKQASEAELVRRMNLVQSVKGHNGTLTPIPEGHVNLNKVLAIVHRAQNLTDRAVKNCREQSEFDDPLPYFLEIASSIEPLLQAIKCGILMDFDVELPVLDGKEDDAFEEGLHPVSQTFREEIQDLRLAHTLEAAYNFETGRDVGFRLQELKNKLTILRARVLDAAPIKISQIETLSFPGDI